MIQIQCGMCEGVGQVSDDKAGSEINCPFCGVPLDVPGTSSDDYDPLAELASSVPEPAGWSDRAWELGRSSTRKTRQQKRGRESKSQSDVFIAIAVVAVLLSGCCGLSLVMWPSGTDTSASDSPDESGVSGQEAFDKFLIAFSLLNTSVHEEAGVKLFSAAEYKGDGIVWVTATAPWVLLGNEELHRENLDSIFDLWRTCETSGHPIAVFILDDQGNQLYMKSDSR